jgi:hypothetical protein
MADITHITDTDIRHITVHGTIHGTDTHITDTVTDTGMVADTDITTTITDIIMAITTVQTDIHTIHTTEILPTTGIGDQ